MANVDRHSAGCFCWIELHTADQNSAKNFYGALFGWNPQDMPMGPDGVYTIFKLQGRDAAAGCSLRPDERSMGVPPHWLTYIAVDNVDGAVTKAQQLGGKILAPAIDVIAVGPRAFARDPPRAAF